MSGVAGLGSGIGGSCMVEESKMDGRDRGERERCGRGGRGGDAAGQEGLKGRGKREAGNKRTAGSALKIG